VGKIQRIKRSNVVPPTRITDPALIEVYNSYSDVSQQVNNMNDAIQQFQVSLGNGLTTLAVTMRTSGGHPTKTTDYYVGAQFQIANGCYWVTAKTVNGFTLNWTTASAGTTVIWILIVE
jgi:hypothetical protein